jgi:hypothetical protein
MFKKKVTGRHLTESSAYWERSPAPTGETLSFNHLPLLKDYGVPRTEAEKINTKNIKI